MGCSLNRQSDGTKQQRDGHNMHGLFQPRLENKSTVKNKCFDRGANTSLKFCRRKTCRKRMKEWPSAIKKRCLNKKLKLVSTCLKKLKRSALGKSFSEDLFNLMARGRRKIISLELSFIYQACDLLKPDWPN